jgi:hypothetical protein
VIAVDVPQPNSVITPHDWQFSTQAACDLGRQNTPEHAELLAKKWLTTQQLAELAETDGLLYKKGKFSTSEQQLVHTAIKSFKRVGGHSFDNDSFASITLVFLEK